MASGNQTTVNPFLPPVDRNNPTQTCAGIPSLYERQFNFTNFGTNTPNAQQPGNKLDLEFNTIGNIVNHLRCRLSQIQRDDGYIRTELLPIDDILTDLEAAKVAAIYEVDQAGQAAIVPINDAANMAIQAAGSATIASQSALNSANSAQTLSSSAALSAMNALTYKNQALVALTECQEILADLLAPAGPVSTTQANATQAQQSAQDALESENAAQAYRSEIQAWHQAIQAYLVQANNAKNAAQQSANAATLSATGASASADQASDYAASASVSAAQALAHSLNYIPGPQGPQGLVGPAGQQGPQGQQGVAGNDGQQGIQGDPGPQGTAGQQWVYRGAYDGGITYAPNDYVTLNGSSYVMINFIGAGGYDPIGWPGSWQLIASKGDQGDIGPAGSDGSNGMDGGSFSDAPYDSNPYIRINGNWEYLSSYDQNSGGGGGGISTSDVSYWLTSSYSSNQPSNFPGWGNSGYVLGWDGYNLSWVYDQTGGSSGADGAQGPQGDQGPPGADGSNGISEAPIDGQFYSRLDANWELSYRDLQGNAAGDPHYSHEVKITIAGTDYWMPIRPV